MVGTPITATFISIHFVCQNILLDFQKQCIFFFSKFKSIKSESISPHAPEITYCWLFDKNLDHVCIYFLKQNWDHVESICPWICISHAVPFPFNLYSISRWEHGTYFSSCLLTNILVAIPLTPNYKCAVMNIFVYCVCLLVFLSDEITEADFCGTGKVEMCHRNVLLQAHSIRTGGSPGLYSSPALDILHSWLSRAGQKFSLFQCAVLWRLHRWRAFSISVEYLYFFFPCTTCFCHSFILFLVLWLTEELCVATVFRGFGTVGGPKTSGLLCPAGDSWSQHSHPDIQVYVEWPLATLQPSLQI